MENLNLFCPQCFKGTLSRKELGKNSKGELADKIKCNKCSFFLSIKRDLPIMDVYDILNHLKWKLVNPE